MCPKVPSHFKAPNWAPTSGMPQSDLSTRTSELKILRCKVCAQLVAARWSMFRAVCVRVFFQITQSLEHRCALSHVCFSRGQATHVRVGGFLCCVCYSGRRCRRQMSQALP